MANSWLRLWHDMPNDPKWRTIAKASKQSIPSVMAVYLHLLVNASNATERGRTQNVCSEDIASALDLDCEQVDLIISAMQGRVLDGDAISGWSRRQVEREDGGAERAKAWREAQKKINQTQPNATERNRTPDTDTDTEEDKEKTNTLVVSELTPCPHAEIILLFAELLPNLPQVRKWEGTRARHLKARWVWVLADLKSKGKPFDKSAGLDFFRRMFCYIAKSDFLMGKTTEWICPGLPWIVGDENFTKIIEGNYENKGAA